MQIIPQYIPAKLRALPTNPFLDDMAWEIETRRIFAKYLLHRTPHWVRLS